MDIELICLLSMLAVFLLANLLLKLPVSISMILGAIAGALVGGQGIPLRHLFEGTFTYVDTILIISTAMLFMTVIQESGALEALNSFIVTRFYKVPALMLILLMLVIMFPGMITGSSTAAVLSAGALVAPVLLLIGIPKEKAGAIIAIGAIMGMAAPPINIPAMLIGGGVDMPYIGFDGPLFLLTIPCAIFAVLFLGLRYCKNLDIEKLKEGLDTEIGKKYGFKLYIPIIVLFVLLVVSKAFPKFPHVKRGKGVFHQFPQFRRKLFHTFQHLHRSCIFQGFRFNRGIIHFLRGMREQVHEHRAILRRDASAVHERALNRPQERQNKRGHGPHRHIATNDFRAAHRLEQQEAFPFVIDAGSLDFIQHWIMLNAILKFRAVRQE